MGWAAAAALAPGALPMSVTSRPEMVPSGSPTEEVYLNVNSAFKTYQKQNPKINS